MHRREPPAGPGSPAAIPTIPVLGTTWYDRGPAYWLRCAGLSLFLLALVALYGGVITTFALPLRGGPGLVVFLALTGACVVLSAVWYLRRARLSHVDYGRADRRGLRELRWYSAAVNTAKALGVLLILGAFVAALLGHHGVVRTAGEVIGLIVAVILIGSVWVSGGAMVVAFVQSLAPRLYTEREARARMVRAAAEHAGVHNAAAEHAGTQHAAADHAGRPHVHPPRAAPGEPATGGGAVTRRESGANPR